MAQDEIRYRMVVIGGSAGSLDVVLKIVACLPRRSGACFVVVVHRRADTESLLTGLLSFKTALPVKEVEDKETILSNHIYLAPPDYHLLLENESSFALDSSEKINYSRPSIDVTFESAAQTFGAGCIGILLSGANADGADGLKKIKEHGGFSIVQDPATADVGYMPQSAINRMKADEIISPEAIGPLLRRLIS